MASSPINPLKAEKFLEAALREIEPLKGTYIYEPIRRDYLEKTEQVDGGYGSWLTRSISYISQHLQISRPEILDVGCGTGELTVLMNTLGFRAKGIDLHERHLRLAKLLASENKIAESNFILSKDGSLPFPDKSIDIVTLFVVLEHLSDSVLGQLLPEIRRVCRGGVFIMVPNKLLLSDDHTGLRFVPWMPRWLATRYIRLRGRRRRYMFSAEGEWDVHYRTLARIVSIFRRNGFTHHFIPDEIVFPPLWKAPPIRGIGKDLKFGNRKFFAGIPFPIDLFVRLGWPKQWFYPYLNLLMLPEPPRTPST